MKAQQTALIAAGGVGLILLFAGRSKGAASVSREVADAVKSDPHTKAAVDKAKAKIVDSASARADDLSAFIESQVAELERSSSSSSTKRTEPPGRHTTAPKPTPERVTVTVGPAKVAPSKPSTPAPTPAVHALEPTRATPQELTPKAPSPSNPEPTLPTGYDPVRARVMAPSVAKHLATKGRNNYARELVKEFQRAAGIPVDGIYAGETRGALIYFGAANAPKSFFKPIETLVYIPPEQRAG